MIGNDNNYETLGTIYFKYDTIIYNGCNHNFANYERNNDEFKIGSWTIIQRYCYENTDQKVLVAISKATHN